MNNTKLKMLTLAVIAAIIPLDVQAQSHPFRQSMIRVAADTTDTTDDTEVPKSWQLRTGASAGNLRYQGGRTESAAALLLKLALGEEVSVGITPTFAHVSYPAVSGSAAGSVSGLADLPVGVGLQHSFGGRFDPNLGFSAGATIPVGDSAKGLGSGSFGSSFDISAGFSPAPKMGVTAGVGHSFSDFSTRSALNGTAAGWGDISAWSDVTDQVSISGGYDRDIGTVDSVYGRSSSISAGVSYNAFGDTNVEISGARGLTGASPLWSISLGFGTAIPSMGGGLNNAIKQLSTAFGGGNHGLSKKGTSSSSTSARRRGRTRI